MDDSANDNEIFIIDEELVEDFLDENNNYGAELFFNYLSSWCDYPRAYMIPSLHKKIIDWFEENSGEIDKFTRTKVIANFKNWVEEADLLGEADGQDDIHDTELLFDILKLIYPTKTIIVVSSKYKNNPNLKSKDTDDLFEYLGNKKEFIDFFEKKYNIGKWDSAY